MEPGSSRGPAAAGIRSEAVPGTTVRVTVEEPAWRRCVRHAERIAAGAASAAGGSANIVLASDRTLRRLNARDRGRDKPTNVLTYPAASPHAEPEILLALGVIRREAVAAQRTVGAHLAHLVVHGALHLAGHDHHRAGDARRMEMAEARILHRLRVSNPWKRA